jgi:hypothetical protein
MTTAVRDITAELPLGSDWEYEWSVTQKGTDGVRAAKTGLTVTAYLSLTKERSTAAAIAGTTVTLTERAALPGTYAGVLDTALLVTACAALVNTTVYEIFAVSGDARDYQALTVVDR